VLLKDRLKFLYRLSGGDCPWPPLWLRRTELYCSCAGHGRV